MSEKMMPEYCRCHLCKVEFTFKTVYKRQVIIVTDRGEQLPGVVESRIVCPTYCEPKYRFISKLTNRSPCHDCA